MMDIVRKRQVNKASAHTETPYKAGTKRLKAGYKFIGGGVIQNVKTGETITPTQ